jgi:hypothetical protein
MLKSVKTSKVLLNSFMNRCGLCAVTLVANEVMMNNNNESIVIQREYMYIIGGYAGWPRDDKRWNGDRTRNDVWRSLDGKKWELVMPPKDKNTMPFVGRGWHACITWHNPKNKSKGVRRHLVEPPEDEDKNEDSRPKIFITGGGYIGSKGKNNAVYSLEGYVDMFWSYDGSTWHRVNYQEGHAESLYSTNEWASTQINGKYTYHGKWGHTIVSMPMKQDLNMDNYISNTSVPIEFCLELQTNDDVVVCKEGTVREIGVPTLFIIGGDTTDGGPVVNDVFISKPGGKYLCGDNELRIMLTPMQLIIDLNYLTVLCELDGITCSNRGSCGPGVTGCICKSPKYIGEYCHEEDENYNSGVKHFTIKYHFIFPLVMLLVEFGIYL